MREILFRAKRKDNGEWVEGDLVHSKTTSRGVITEIYSLEFIYEVLPETVGQFTGLTDKNGNKIFEGDIVSFIVFDYNDNGKQHKGVVKWSDTEQIATQFLIWHDNKNEYYGADGAFDLGWVHYQDCEFEVIGNIHDNPELLK